MKPGEWTRTVQPGKEMLGVKKIRVEDRAFMVIHEASSGEH